MSTLSDYGFYVNACTQGSYKMFYFFTNLGLYLPIFLFITRLANLAFGSYMLVTACTMPVRVEHLAIIKSNF